MHTAGCTDTQCVLALTVLMDGHAANVFWILPDRVRMNYPELVERLFHFFAPPENTQRLMWKFQDHKQRTGLDIFTYVNELRVLLFRADPDVDPVHAERQIAEQLRVGALPKWRKELVRHFGYRSVPLDEMVAHIAALAEDEELDATDRSHRSPWWRSGRILTCQS